MHLLRVLSVQFAGLTLIICYADVMLLIFSCVGKSRKLASLFRRSSKEDLLSSGSGRFERSSGRGKRKTSKGSSSRDSSLDGLSSDVSEVM